MNGFTIVQPDGPLYRLARTPDPWAGSLATLHTHLA